MEFKKLFRIKLNNKFIKIHFLLTVFLCFSIFQSFGQDAFSVQLSNLLGDEKMKGASLGLLVCDASDGSVVYQKNPDLLLVPASVQKLIVSGAALEILGPDYRFKTRLLMEGEPESKSRMLKGNLIIKGGGDPTLGSMYFSNEKWRSKFLDHWLNMIIMKGIRGINGNICIDETAYEEQVTPPTWIWEDMGNYYGAGANAISVFDNMFRITFQTDDEPGVAAKIIKIDPRADWLKMENLVVSSDENSDKAYVYGDPWGNIRKIRGTIPRGRDSFQIKASLPEPGLALGILLKKKLESKNIPVSGKVVKNSAGPNAVVVYEDASPALSEILKVLNHESVNLFAEHLAKQLAYELNGVGAREDGLKIIKEFWKEKGIDTHEMFLEDGSGLSRFNALSPKQLSDVLLYMKNKSSNFEVFQKSLPAPGEGTLYYFNPDDFQEGSLRCKSGSMTRVRCYAGYIKTQSGEDLVFSLMVNNFSMSQSELIKRIEKLLIGLTEK